MFLMDIEVSANKPDAWTVLIAIGISMTNLVSTLTFFDIKTFTVICECLSLTSFVPMTILFY